MLFNKTAILFFIGALATAVSADFPACNNGASISKGNCNNNVCTNTCSDGSSVSYDCTANPDNLTFGYDGGDLVCDSAGYGCTCFSADAGEGTGIGEADRKRKRSPPNRLSH